MVELECALGSGCGESEYARHPYPRLSKISPREIAAMISPPGSGGKSEKSAMSYGPRVEQARWCGNKKTEHGVSGPRDQQREDDHL